VGQGRVGALRFSAAVSIARELFYSKPTCDVFQMNPIRNMQYI